MWLNSQETADLVTFTEEILDEKLQFLCSEYAFSLTHIPQYFMQWLVFKCWTVFVSKHWSYGKKYEISSITYDKSLQKI